MPLSLSSRIRQLLAAVLFAGAIALNAWTLTRALRPHSVEKPLAPTAIAEANELASAEHDIVGTYVTGERPGDRLIVIERGGIIRFSDIGVSTTPLDADTFTIGKIGKTRHLATRHRGTIEVAGIDALIYYGDRYTRTKVPPQPSDPSAPAATPRPPARSAS